MNVPGILLTTLLAASSIGAQTRCGLTLIPERDRDDFALGLATKVARAGADANALLHTTEHFAIWYKLGNDPDSLEAPWNAIPNGDSVPRIVRTIGKDMDKAWKYYVDTLGLRAPAAAPTGLAFGVATPPGLYPVEFCRPEAALRDPKYDTIQVFGLTTSDPTNPERSNVLLSSRVLGSGWNYNLDTGGTLSSSYRVGDGWLKAMRATAVHELLHASQFRYERSLRHFLFEASAVAMEERLIPEVHDHLALYESLYRPPGTDIASTKGLLASISGMAYRHGLYLTGLMDERGESIIPALWEDRAARAPADPYGTTILGTMSSTLGGTQGGWRESLVRYGMRILLSGKRRSWGAPWSDPDGFVPWSKAALAPVPTVLSAYPSIPGKWSSWTLAGGDLKFLSDAPIAGDLQVSWVGDSATFLVRLDSLPSGFVRETIPHGTTVIPASRRSKSLWILGSDGTSPFAANPNRSTIASASLSFDIPDTAFPVVAGARFRHVFAATGRNKGGQILEGISLVTDSVLPVLDSGLFLPDSILDREGTLLAKSGSRWTLRDSRGKLLLRDATLSFPDRSETKAYVSAGLGWDRIPAANALVFRGDSTSDRTKVQAFQLAWPSLSLVDQTKLILTNAPSVSPLLEKVYPNPSLGDQPVNFRISGNTEGVRLTILASDGSLVRTWTGGEMGLEMAWDLRNAQGNRVRPGVYTWILSGPGLSKRGRLLVAR